MEYDVRTPLCARLERDLASSRLLVCGFGANFPIIHIILQLTVLSGLVLVG